VSWTFEARFTQPDPCANVCTIDPEPVGATKVPSRKQRQAGGSRDECCTAMRRRRCR